MEVRVTSRLAQRNPYQTSEEPLDRLMLTFILSSR